MDGMERNLLVSDSQQKKVVDSLRLGSHTKQIRALITVQAALPCSDHVIISRAGSQPRPSSHELHPPITPPTLGHAKDFSLFANKFFINNFFLLELRLRKNRQKCFLKRGNFPLI